MFNHPLALELAYIAVEEVVRLGASYADARFELTHQEDIGTFNGSLRHCSESTNQGMSVRALVRGAWGQVAVSEPSRHEASVAARRAVDAARAAAIIQSERFHLVPPRPERSVFRTPTKRDPLSVPLDEKLNLLFQIDGKLRQPNEVVLARTRFRARRQRRLLVNSEGAEIDQELIYTGLAYQAGASDGVDLALRSFHGGPGGLMMGKGWEMIYELEPVSEADRVAAEAVELVHAESCPELSCPVVLSPYQMAAQVVHTLAPLVSGDADGALLTHPSIDLASNASLAGGAGSYGYDDDGRPGKHTPLIVHGRRVGTLAEADIGLSRAAAWNTAPAAALANLEVVPSVEVDQDSLLSAAEGGLYIDGPIGFVVDRLGGRFSASAEVARTIVGGKLGPMRRRPQYVGGLGEIWRACQGVASEESYRLSGGVHEDHAVAGGVTVGSAAPAGLFDPVSVGPRRYDGRRQLPSSDLYGRSRRPRGESRRIPRTDVR